jgi:hypothetical protein
MGKVKITKLSPGESRSSGSFPRSAKAEPAKTHPSKWWVHIPVIDAPTPSGRIALGASGKRSGRR